MTENKEDFWTKFKAEMEKHFFSFLRQLPFLVICWGIGFYLLRQCALRLDLDDEKTLSTQLIFLFLLSIFLILLPFAKKIKFLNVFELEREIKEAKQEVKDFKTEIRQSLALFSNSLSASIGSMNNQITVHVPGVEDLKKANRTIEEKGKFKDTISFEDIREELSISDDEDTIMALAKTRIKIETLLRELLGKRTTFPNDKNEMKFLSLSELHRQFTKNNPDFRYLDNSFKYVQQICNAAIHGMNISLGQAEEALELGARIIKELEYLKANSGQNGFS